MGKSLFDYLAAPITAPLDAAGGVIHGLGNAVSDIPVVGKLAKFGGIATGDLLHGASQGLQGHFANAANDDLASVSDAIHGVNKVPVVGPYILPAVAGFFGGPLGYGAASGIQSGFEASRNGVPAGKAALGGAENGAVSAAASYAGGQLAGQLGSIGSGVAPVSGGATAGALGTPISQSLGDTALSGVGDALGKTTPADVLGAGVGGALATNINSKNPLINPLAPIADTSNSLLDAPFSPTEASQAALPSSLSSYQGLDPLQQATNIASKGVYGGGEGADETNYFNNLINRQLYGSNGQLAADTSSINPVENSFLNQIGLGGYKSPTDLLQKISNYQYS